MENPRKATSIEDLQVIGERHNGFREGYDLRDACIRLGNTLRQLRESAGFTQEQLASSIGLPHANVARLESGLDPCGQELDAVLRFVHGCDARLSLDITPRAARQQGEPRVTLHASLS